jgi:hypothetical protein
MGDQEMKLGICTAVALAALVCASQASAGVIIDTFGPGNTFDSSSGGYTVSGSDLSAVGFTLGSSGTIDDVAVAAQAANYSLYIVGDNGGLPGATVLGTVSSSFTINGYIEFDPSIALAAGDYWLVMSGPPNVLDGWYPNIDGLSGPFRQSDSNGADWEFGSEFSWLPAVRIGFTEGSQIPVPEPSTLVLAAAGLLGMAAVRRRRA